MLAWTAVSLNYFILKHEMLSNGTPNAEIMFLPSIRPSGHFSLNLARKLESRDLYTLGKLTACDLCADSFPR